ncbi:hypothetical protein WN51_02074 [Melipona quadrifasciata]|uniref:Uncharacterized protein n=1 Tax=Melipona quadrifasciata TaxID=166423 RepID=A0A0M8ZXB3_9HYME|nr:hypothetical protein WN51_02074 [Melipona quadrifasciata]
MRRRYLNREAFWHSSRTLLSLCVLLQRPVESFADMIGTCDILKTHTCSCPEYTYTCPRIGQVFSLSSYMGEYRQEVTTDKTELERNYRKSKMVCVTQLLAELKHPHQQLSISEKYVVVLAELKHPHQQLSISEKYVV